MIIKENYDKAVHIIEAIKDLHDNIKNCKNCPFEEDGHCSLQKYCYRKSVDDLPKPQKIFFSDKLIELILAYEALGKSVNNVCISENMPQQIIYDDQKKTLFVKDGDADFLKNLFCDDTWPIYNFGFNSIQKEIKRYKESKEVKQDDK